MTTLFNSYLFNPVFWHVLDAIHNPKIRRIMVRGGSSAGKTYSICDAINLEQLSRVLNVLAVRKQRVHVETTIKKSFEASIDRLRGLDAYYQKMDGEIRVATGALTTYSGMDDAEKMKGLESYDMVYLTELNQFLEAEYDEVNRRLRGRPNQKIVADWNPILSTHWINTAILGPDQGWQDLPLSLPDYERDFGAFTTLCKGYAFKRINQAGDTLWINVTYRDNFWIVGHPGNTEPAQPGEITFRDADPSRQETLGEGMYVAPDGNIYGFLDHHQLAVFDNMRQKKPNDYRIYGLGEDGLIRTGNEFWPQFREEEHVRQGLDYDPAYAIHVTVDNNFYPYVTVAPWQVVGWELRQIAELPCRAPNNNARKAALELDAWLLKRGHRLSVVVYGDPSSNAKSTNDDEGRSFFDKFVGTLREKGWRVVDKVGKSAPGVALSADFVNDIYLGEVEKWRIVINLACRTSITDYSLVKRLPDGSMDKKKVPDPLDPSRKIELYGHFSDAKRYFITQLLATLFANYKNRQRQPRIMAAPEK